MTFASLRGGSRARARQDEQEDMDKRETRDGKGDTTAGKAKKAATHLNIQSQRQREIRKEEERAAQRNPGINHNSTEFLDKEREFDRKLRDPTLSIATILEDDFTKFEADLLYPASKADDAALFALQRDNRRRFEELRSGRFSGNAAIQLPTQLAMLYFGLPVGPMKLGGLPMLGFGIDDDDDSGDVGDSDDNDDDGGDGGDETGAFAPEPLKFLNAYAQRGYGKTVWRNGATDFDKYYSQSLSDFRHYWQPSSNTMSLRGGGNDDDLVDLLGCPDSRQSCFIEDKARPQNWFPLYGFQGVVYFELDSYGTYVDALMRLLGLDAIEGVTINGMVYHRKGGDGLPFKLSFTEGGDGRWDSVQSLFRREGNKVVLFVCRDGESGPKGVWEPAEDQLKKYRVVRCKNSNDSGDVAYLHIPEDADYIFDQNHFSKWFTSMARILTPGRLPGLPGRPLIAPTWILGANDRSIGLDIYGGLGFPRMWWHYIVRKFDRGEYENEFRKEPSQLEMWNIYIPGLKREREAKGQPPLTFDVDKAKNIYEYIMRLFEANLAPSFAPAGFEYWVGSAVLDSNEPGTRVRFARGGAVTEFTDRMERLARSLRPWGSVTEAPLLLSVRPLYDKYKAQIEVGDERLEFPFEASTGVSGLINSMKVALGSRWEDFFPFNLFQVEIRQPKDTSEPHEFGSTEDRPEFTVTAETTPHDWVMIWRQIVHDVVMINPAFLIPPDSVDYTLYSWGYRHYGGPGRKSTSDPPAKLRVDGQRSKTSEDPPTKLRVDEQRSTTSDWLRTYESHRGRKAQSPEDPARHLLLEKEPVRNLLLEKDPARHLPPRPLTDGECNERLRDMAYAGAPSIFDGQFPRIPLHAPPVETFIKTAGDGPPLVSRGLLTPSEAARMHLMVNKLRNIVLDRIAMCPYEGCERWFPMADKTRMGQHLRQAHEAEACNFCDTPLYKDWSAEQRENHYLSKHSELFRDANGLKGKFTAVLPEPGPHTLLAQGKVKEMERKAFERKETSKAKDASTKDNKARAKKAVRPEKAKGGKASSLPDLVEEEQRRELDPASFDVDRLIMEARRRNRGGRDHTYRPKKGEGGYSDDNDVELDASAVREPAEGDEAAKDNTGRAPATRKRRRAESEPPVEAEVPPKRSRTAASATKTTAKSEPPVEAEVPSNRSKTAASVTKRTAKMSSKTDAVAPPVADPPAPLRRSNRTKKPKSV